ncbi:MAG: hypothetical protein R3279_08350 [Putridiphycobacter sp.]|nr:hypothetical protein [Putridiphycobacter sp.]
MKTTQLTQRKAKHESNQLFIQQVTGLTDNEYNDFWLDLGKAFLKEFYGGIDQYYNYHHGSRQFWKWWHAEFKKWENEFLSCYHFSTNQTFPEILNDQLGQMVADRHVENSFLHNYLKFCKIP